MYRFTLTFTRTFTRGALVGMTHDDALPFCTESDARAWVDAVNATADRGNLSYRVTSHAVSPRVARQVRA